MRALSAFPHSDIDDLAVEAADDALMALLRKLEDYRGDSQFWTWARRFAALEAPVQICRHIGHDHVGIARDPDVLLNVADRGASVADQVELRERLPAVSAAVAGSLTARQRQGDGGGGDKRRGAPRWRANCAPRPVLFTRCCTMCAARCARRSPHDETAADKPPSLRIRALLAVSPGSRASARSAVATAYRPS